MYNEEVEIFFLFIVGACVGSFLGALTWRWPREIAVSDGRSKCFHCGHTIAWHDNIPILSYLVLRGRCRSCHKKIPRRDFLVETGTAILFPSVYLLMPSALQNLPWLMNYPKYLALLILLVIVSFATVVFVIDMEHQYIPDTAVFGLLALVFLVFIVADVSALYTHVLSGFGTALFLLTIHLITLGRGMGLGDVKLAIPIGMILGFPLSVVWMFLAFVLGSIVGIILIIFKLAKFKQKIAFGPFLIASFALTILLGINILNTLYFFY